MNDWSVTPLRVLIVDDEPLARARLRSLLADAVLPPAQVVAEAAHGAEALQCLAQRAADIDLVLLDIHMPGQGGLELAARLREGTRRPAVVFVTAHAEHALKAFDVEAVDYLTKPVRRARLQEALARAATWLGRREAVVAAAAALPEGSTLWVHEGAALERVPLVDVLYLKAEGKQVQLRTALRRYVLDDSLAELLPRLGDRFLRIHRNAVVARQAVSALVRRAAEGAADTTEEDAARRDDPSAGWAVCIEATQEWLAVSRRQLAAVRQALAQDGL